MTNFYFTDRKHNLLEIVSTEDTRIKASKVTDMQSINDSVRVFEATLIFEEEDHETADKITQVGNFVLYKDLQGDSVWITIESQEYDPEEGLVSITGRDASIDLINEVRAPFTPDKAYTIAEYIKMFTNDSGFEIGTNEIPDNKRTLTAWENENTSLERVLSVANQFEVEIDFSFEIDGLDVVKKYINVYKKRGLTDNNTSLYVGTELRKIVSKKDVYNLYNAIKAEGAIPEGKETPITLKGYKYTDSTGQFILDSDGVLKDTESVKEWSRLLSNENPNPTTSYIYRYKSFDTTDQKKLFDMALADLKKSTKVTENYEIEIISLPKQIKIGETINAIDEKRKIFLTARILSLEYDHVYGDATATLGDFLVQQGDDLSNLKALASQLQSQVKTIEENTRGKSVVVTSKTPPNETENVLWIDISSQHAPIKTWHEETKTWVPIYEMPIEVSLKSDAPFLHRTVPNVKAYATVKQGYIDITDRIPDYCFVWKKVQGTGWDESWGERIGQTITLTRDDVKGKTFFDCVVEFEPEEIWTTNG